MGRHIFAAAVLVGIASLSGCSSIPTRGAAPTTNDTSSFASARAYAEGVRKNYLDHVDEKTRNHLNLGDGLISLGGALAAVAYGGSHLDAVVYPGLAGGTAYTLGERGYSKQMQLIYLAGAKAIHCAIRTLSPLDVDTGRQSILSQQLVGVDTAPSPFAAAWANTRGAARKASLSAAELARLAPTDPLVAEAAARVTAVDTLLQSSSATQASGIKLLHRAKLAPGELVNAVAGIVSDVDMARQQTLPSLASIGQIVGSLTQFADVYAPGAGISSHVAAAFAAYKPKSDEKIEGMRGDKGGAPQSNSLVLAEQLARAELKQGLAALAGVEADLEARHLVVKDIADAVRDATSGNTLADCKVEGGIAVLGADTTQISAVKGVERRYSVTMRGGVRPYVARLAQSPMPGVEVKSPLPFEHTVEVQVGKDWDGTPVTVQVFDSTAPDPHMLTIPVVAVTVASAAAGGQAGAVDIGVSVNDLIRDHAKDLPIAGSDSKLSVTGACDDAGCPVACSPKLTTPTTADDLKKLIMLAKVVIDGKDHGTIGALIKGVKDADKLAKFKVKPDASNSCNLQTDVSEGSGGRKPDPVKQTRRLLTVPQASVIQAHLCLKGNGVDGNWGKHSHAAFASWRKAQGKPQDGVMTMDERDELLARSIDCRS